MEDFLPKNTIKFDKYEYVKDTYGENELLFFQNLDMKLRKNYSDYLYQRLHIAKVDPSIILSPISWAKQRTHRPVSYNQIAAKLNLSVKMIKQIEKEALQKIRILLEQRNIMEMTK